MSMSFESFNDKVEQRRIALESKSYACDIQQKITVALGLALAQIEADIANCLDQVFSSQHDKSTMISLINNHHDVAEAFIRGVTRGDVVLPKNTTEYTEDDWYPISLKLKDTTVKVELSFLYLKRDVVKNMCDYAARKDFITVAKLFDENKKLVQQGTDWWRVWVDRITKFLSELCTPKKLRQRVLYTQLAPSSNVPLFGASVRKNICDKLYSSVSAYQKVATQLVV